MFVLRVTSDTSLHGVKTDDGFIIGRFSAETLFLIIATAALGVLGGSCTSAFDVVAGAAASPLAGVFGGIVGGALVISPDGLDFTRLEPLPLAVAMFIALPALYGATMSLFVERLLREDSRFGRSRGWFLG